MAIVEPERRDVQHPKQNKKYSSPLRLWHWLNFVVITASLLTVLLNSTLLDGRENAVFIKEQLQKVGATITDEQSISAAHGISDKIWQIQVYCGYVL